MNILLIEDDPALVGVLRSLLDAAGHRMVSAATATDGIADAASSILDLVLIDLGLPDMDGKQAISAIRAFSSIPIIVVSARNQEAEKISALDCGADDYVNKPFEIGELLARMRAAVRRSLTDPKLATKFVSREVEIDFGTRSVLLMGQPVKLSPKEFDLLATLAHQAGQVVTHRRLLNAGWSGSSNDVQNLRSYIALLRQKLEIDPAEPQLILTDSGVGYRLNVTFESR